MNAREWLTELGAAADELGYGISEIRHDSIELLSNKKQRVKVRIESIFLSGALLKEVLAGNPETESER